jgi:hypothetical protein
MSQILLKMPLLMIELGFESFLFVLKTLNELETTDKIDSNCRNLENKDHLDPSSFQFHNSPSRPINQNPHLNSTKTIPKA